LSRPLINDGALYSDRRVRYRGHRGLKRLGFLASFCQIAPLF